MLMNLANCVPVPVRSLKIGTGKIELLVGGIMEKAMRLELQCCSGGRRCQRSEGVHLQDRTHGLVIIGHINKALARDFLEDQIHIPIPAQQHRAGNLRADQRLLVGAAEVRQLDGLEVFPGRNGECVAGFEDIEPFLNRLKGRRPIQAGLFVRTLFADKIFSGLQHWQRQHQEEEGDGNARSDFVHAHVPWHRTASE